MKQDSIQRHTRRHAVANWVINHPWLILILSILLLGTCIQGLSKLKFSINYEYFFGADNPQLQAYNKMKDAYTDTDNLVFMVIPKDGTVFQKEVLTAVESLTELSWQLPYVNRVDSISNFQHTQASDDELVVENLYENPKALAKDQIDFIEEIALSEPLLLDFLQASNKQATAVVATFNLPNESPKEITELIEFAKGIIAHLETQHPQVNILPIGLTMLSYTYGEASRADIKTLTPLMLLVVMVLVAVLTRSAWSTFLSFNLITITVISAMGLFAATGKPLTTITAIAPTIIMALVMAHLVHIVETFYQHWQTPFDKKQALARSIEMNIKPIFITSITTLVGFLSMNFNDVPPYRDLGNLVAMAVILAFFFCMFTLPAALTLLPVRPRKAKLYQSSFQRLSTWVGSNRLGILVISAGLLALSVWLIPQNILNEKYVEQFDQRFEFRRNSDYFAENISGIYSIEYSVSAIETKTNAIADPHMLQTLEEFANWLRVQPYVRHVTSITDTFKRLNQNMHGDDLSEYKLPNDADLAAQYLLLYEMSLPYGLDLNNQLNHDKSASRIMVRLDDMSATEIMNFDESVHNWWQKHNKQYQVEGASTSLMFTHIVERAINSMVEGTLAAFLLIALILMIALKSFKLGLISLIPNILPICLGLGLWTVLNGEIGMSFAIVVVLTLGIIVDDTVHFLSKYQYARENLGMNNAQALEQSFKTVGIALTITTLALVIGFAVLSMSGFARNADMGLMAAITVMLALVVDLLVLPALLHSDEEAEADTETLAKPEILKNTLEQSN